MCKEIQGFHDKFTLEEFTKEVYLVHSRNFISTVNGTETNVQIPFADMFNTDAAINTAWYYSDEKEGFVVEAAKDIKAGEQLFDWYGNKCNSDFLKNYGFINNDADGLNSHN